MKFRDIISSFFIFSRLLRVLSLLANEFRPSRDKTGRLSPPYLKKRERRNFQVLVYHRVNDGGDRFFAATPTHVFRSQMQHLRSHYNVLDLGELVGVAKERTVPPNAIAVTFDDGYKDMFVNAFPILRELKIPATVFLPTEAIETRKGLWHDQVFSAFRETKVKELRCHWHQSLHFRLESLEEKLAAQQAVLNILRSLNSSERSAWIQHLGEKLQVGEDGGGGELMLTWDEIKIMQSHGISFGAHSMTHAILATETRQIIMEEVSHSKTLIEERLVCPVRGFAYPSGRKKDFNETAKSIVKECGYDYAVTMIFGSNEADQDVFELRRGLPWEENPKVFAMKLTLYKLLN